MNLNLAPNQLKHNLSHFLYQNLLSFSIMMKLHGTPSLERQEFESMHLTVLLQNQTIINLLWKPIYSYLELYMVLQFSHRQHQLLLELLLDKDCFHDHSKHCLSFHQNKYVPSNCIEDLSLQKELFSQFFQEHIPNEM